MHLMTIYGYFFNYSLDDLTLPDTVFGELSGHSFTGSSPRESPS